MALLAFPLFASAQRCADPGAHDACERMRPPGLAQAIVLPDKAALSPVSRKIAFALRQAAAVIRAYSPAARASVALSGLSTEAVRVDNAGEIQVYVILSEHRPAYVAQLEAMGLRVELALPEFRVVQGWLPADLIELVAASDFVVEVKPPGYPIPKVGAQLTAGDSIMKADSARATFGVTGAGVTVGVISDGVDHRACIFKPDQRGKV